MTDSRHSWKLAIGFPWLYYHLKWQFSLHVEGVTTWPQMGEWMAHCFKSHPPCRPIVRTIFRSRYSWSCMQGEIMCTWSDWSCICVDIRNKNNKQPLRHNTKGKVVYILASPELQLAVNDKQKIGHQYKTQCKTVQCNIDEHLHHYISSSCVEPRPSIQYSTIHKKTDAVNAFHYYFFLHIRGKNCYTIIFYYVKCIVILSIPYFH